MAESISKWMTWAPKASGAEGGKSGEMDFAHFATFTPQAFLQDEVDESVSNALTAAISTLSKLCPDDQESEIDWRLEAERQRLGRLPLRTVDDVQKWLDGWRIHYAELRIDRNNEGDKTGQNTT